MKVEQNSHMGGEKKLTGMAWKSGKEKSFHALYYLFPKHLIYINAYMNLVQVLYTRLIPN